MPADFEANRMANSRPFMTNVPNALLLTVAPQLSWKPNENWVSVSTPGTMSQSSTGTCGSLALASCRVKPRLVSALGSTVMPKFRLVITNRSWSRPPAVTSTARSWPWASCASSPRFGSAMAAETTSSRQESCGVLRPKLTRMSEPPSPMAPSTVPVTDGVPSMLSRIWSALRSSTPGISVQGWLESIANVNSLSEKLLASTAMRR